MKKKIVIIGGVAGGASAAARLRRLSETDEIIMFERGPHVSFSNCSLPYHLSGIVPTADKLVLMSPEKFDKSYNIDARTLSEVIEIDRKNKEVVVKKLNTNEIYRESYDKLILSPGAKPIVPNIKGIEKAKVYTIRNVVDIDKLNQSIKTLDNPKISVIGGGFIGVEAAENLKEAGYQVNLIEASNQILGQFDYDMVQILHKELFDKGIDLIVDDRVTEFDENNIILASGKKVESDVVILAIGVLAETNLAKEAGILLGESGNIEVDINHLTNDKNIYAVGDAIEVTNSLNNNKMKLPLAGPAQKQARNVADHINGRETLNRGYIGSSVIKVFDYNAASTGLNEKHLKNMDIDYDIVRIIPGDKVGLMPDREFMHFKLLFEKGSGKILGAQGIGKGNVDKRIDVIATVLKFGGDLDDLRDLELTYAPPFGTAKDIVNYGGYVGTNINEGSAKVVRVENVRNLLDQGVFLVDIREIGEHKRGHIKESYNLPLSQLRERYNELPKDKPLYLYCKSGQRSYNAAMALQNLGYKEVYNISGGIQALSYFEYYNDKVTNREKILTEYSF